MPCSLKLAQKLKAAGLEWEPKLLDCYVIDDNNIPELDPSVVCIAKTQSDIDAIKELSHAWHPRVIQTVWLPHLDQLLTEIEARGWRWSFATTGSCYGCYIVNVDSKKEHESITGTPEDVAARALLWILEQTGGGND